MKKVIAIILAVLMLGSVTAFADTCPVFTLDDPVLTLNMGEEPMVIDLTGLSVVFGAVEASEEPTVAVNIIGNGEVLLAAIMKVAGDQALWTATGLSNTYAAPTFNPAEATAAIQEIDLSGLDFDAIVESFVSSVKLDTQEDGTINFTIPYTAFNEVLEAVLPLMDQLPEGIEVDPEEVAAFIADLKENQKGVTVSGSAKLSENGLTAVVNFIPVSDGVEAENPALALDIVGEMGENGFHGVFTASAASSESGMLSEVCSIEINFENGEAGAHGTFVVSADVSGSGELSEVLSAEFSLTDKFDIDVLIMGMYRVYLSVNPADRSVVLGFSGAGVEGELSFTYSVNENGEIEVISLDEANAINMMEMTEEQEQQFMSELTQIGGALASFFMSALGNAA